MNRDKVIQCLLPSLFFQGHAQETFRNQLQNFRHESIILQEAVKRWILVLVYRPKATNNLQKMEHHVTYPRATIKRDYINGAIKLRDG